MANGVYTLGVVGLAGIVMGIYMLYSGWKSMGRISAVTWMASSGVIVAGFFFCIPLLLSLGLNSLAIP